MRQTTNYTTGACCVLVLENFKNRMPRGRTYDTLSELETHTALGGEDGCDLGWKNIEKGLELMLQGVGDEEIGHDDGVKLIRASLYGFISKSWAISVKLGKREIIYSPVIGVIDGSNDKAEFHGGIESSVVIDIGGDISQFIKYLINMRYNNVHIIKGRDDKFVELYDTVSYLVSFYQKSNCNVKLVSDDEISILNNRLFLGDTIVSPGDTIWVKIDPNQSERYFSTLRMLVPFEDQNIIFVNPPSVILAYDDKTIPLITGKVKNQKIINTTKMIRPTKYFFRNKGDLVIMRCNGFGDRDVKIVSNDDDLGIISGTAPFIIEKSVAKPGNNIDSRIFWFNGKLVGVVNRFGHNNDLSNIPQGDGIELGDLSVVLKDKDLREQVSLIGDFLRDNHCIIAGIDVLNGVLITKVNISNPSLFKNYIEMSGDNFLFNLPT